MFTSHNFSLFNIIYIRSILQWNILLPYPHAKFHLSEVKFWLKSTFSHIVLVFLTKTFFVCSKSIVKLSPQWIRPKTRWHKCALSPNLAREKCQLQGAISQLQIMIKTQFLHFSNIVFPEFSKSIVKLSQQWIVLLKTTKNQMTQVCSITKSGTREVSTSRSHISASNYDKNTFLALF